MSSRLASPSTGDAASLTRTRPSRTPLTAERPARGTVCTLSTAPAGVSTTSIDCVRGWLALTGVGGSLDGRWRGACAEDGGTHPDHGRALGDGHLEVVAHAHR